MPDDPERRHSIAYAGSISRGPKYWVPERALLIHPLAARAWGIEHKPLSEWTLEDKLRVALTSLGWDDWTEDKGSA